MEELPALPKKKDRAEASTQDSLPKTKGEDLLLTLELVRWEERSVLENSEARGTLEQLVEICHPSVLQFLATLMWKRALKDVSLKGLGKDMKELLRLGDVMYARRRR